VLILGPVIPDEQQVSPSTVDTRTSSLQETSGALINSAHATIGGHDIPFSGRVSRPPARGTI
jgi:hypothetical protein